jgi:hypothetical protein
MVEEPYGEDSRVRSRAETVVLWTSTKEVEASHGEQSYRVIAG